MLVAWDWEERLPTSQAEADAEGEGTGVLGKPTFLGPLLPGRGPFTSFTLICIKNLSLFNEPNAPKSSLMGEKLWDLQSVVYLEPCRVLNLMSP